MTVVEALRTAYIAAMVNSRQEGARASADALAGRAKVLQNDVTAMEEKRKGLEKATGVALEGGHRDLDASRMEYLAKQLPSKYRLGAGTTVSLAAAQLASLDSQINQAAGSLGPNNPRLQAMQRQRAVLAAQVAQERNVTYADPAQVDAQSRVILLDAQKAKVLSQREKVLALRLVQDEIDAKAEEVKDINLRVAQLREMSNLNATSASPIGVATVEPRPAFPDPTLILGGTATLGVVLGCLMAIFVELMGRRVRAEKDLTDLIAAPLLGVVPEWRPGGARRRRARPLRKPRRLLAPAGA
jgi:succinoglycan biosynthesis transport protein ExoP